MARRTLALLVFVSAPFASFGAGAELAVTVSGEPTFLVQRFSADPPVWEWGLGFAGAWARLDLGIPLAERLRLHTSAGVGLWALEALAGLGFVIVPARKGPGLELRAAGFGIAYNPLFMDKVYWAAGGQLTAVLSVPLGAAVDATAALGARYTHYVDFDRSLAVPVEIGLTLHPGGRR